MHVYIYDDYLNNSHYNRIINRIEIRLTDLGLNGKIIRLGKIKNIKGSIENEIKLGAKTFITVGNNETVNKIIRAIINANIYSDFQNKTLLGIIPVGNNNSIATSFGIKNELEACNILLARRIKKIDLGLVAGHYFLNKITIESLNTILEIDDYRLEATERGEIKIINLLSVHDDLIKSSPYDGLLDLSIRTKRKNKTYLKTKALKIYNPNYKLLVDDVMEIETPADISVIKNKINVIVGKKRLFD